MTPNNWFKVRRIDTKHGKHLVLGHYVTIRNKCACVSRSIYQTTNIHQVNMVSYAVHYELNRTHHQETILSDFGSMRLDMTKEQPQVLYVAMATWIPKCNMVTYQSHQQQINSEDVSITEDGQSVQKVLDNSTSNNVDLDSTEQSEGSKVTTEEETSIDHKADSITQDSLDILNISVSSALEVASTPKKVLTPKQLQKKLESEKKKLERQKEREEREKQKNEEKERILAEKQKLKQQKEAEKQKVFEEKQKQLQLKQKEKEVKEEQKRKEREEKEQKRKEKEEKEEQKRRERELEKQKKQQELEERNKEKQREEEKKQKTAALFANFFKKSDGVEREKKIEKNNSTFMPFEIKSDMRLPPIRRKILSDECLNKLDEFIKKQNEDASYLKDLKLGKIKPTISFKTWPDEDSDNDLILLEDDKDLGETICDSTSNVKKMRAKFFLFHENRRPPYFGTWRKKSDIIRPRKPLVEDTKYFNYEEDSDDDWEEEEQGESLDVSGDEDDKDIENEQDDYEVDNDFFVPHGHLSEDEMDDEEDAKLSPESLKQKLKLLKDAFDEDMKSKTHKLKPRSIGCIWINKKGDNIEEGIQRYLQPFAIFHSGPIEIKSRCEIFVSSPDKKKNKTPQELSKEHVLLFFKVIHGSRKKKKLLIEEFLTYMANQGIQVEVSKANLLRYLKQSATYKKCKENGPLKNKYGWFLNDDIKKQYNITLGLDNEDKK
ncbi:chromatin assembly factor 1 subunit A-A-like isoform X1 [Rhynchophorus ferrugineus]|uniref:chromatin assembly factor 1 subunit A-A-like isoform X1 n=2 Tax=Rhynchophorus ferrugineus TaxID=354439 RepID=UPI003FCE24FC